MKPPPGAALFFFLLSIPLLIGGGLFLSLAFHDISEAESSAVWPITNGTIVGSSLSQTGGNNHIGPHGGGGPGTFNYYPNIEYTYSVNGKSYVGDKVYPALFWSHRSSQHAVDQYPYMSQQTVHYSFTNPGNAVLIVGLHLAAFQRLIISTLILSIGILIALAGCANVRYLRSRFPSSVFSNYCMLLIVIQIIYLFFTA